jgi:prepilin-type N-terminal cleavage/methylation domain-containing protein
MIRQTRQLKHGTKTQGGFSLIELLIVVSVILVIAAIAIPNFIRSKMRANEASAVQNLRTIATANTVYITTYGIGYSTDLTKLGGNLVIVDANNAGLIDSVLATGTKSGYSYNYSVTASDALGHPVGYSITADPMTVGTTGERYFYTDQSAIIRYTTTTTATAADPAI